MDFPFEVVLAYNGTNGEYINQLAQVYDFDHVVSSTRYRFELIQEAYEHGDGDYYMHLEDDFYWDNPKAVQNAVSVLESLPEVSFVRMEFLPFQMKHFQKIIDVDDDKFGLFKLKRDGGPSYQFCLNPHLRRDKIPIKYGFIDTKKYLELVETKPIQPEHWMSNEWDKEEKLSGCLLGKNFRHLGLYDTGGHKKFWYSDRFFLERNSPQEFNAVEEFNKFCINKVYRELFAEYIRRNEK